MPVSCHDMKKGQIYLCEACGLELQVLAECKSSGIEAEACECEVHCNFSCCGQNLKLKA